jgi:hypothetical protein
MIKFRNSKPLLSGRASGALLTIARFRQFGTRQSHCFSIPRETLKFTGVMREAIDAVESLKYNTSTVKEIHLIHGVDPFNIMANAAR